MKTNSSYAPFIVFTFFLSICCRVIEFFTLTMQQGPLDKLVQAEAIGLGYVAIEHANLDSEIYIDIRNGLVKAKVAKAPFA